MGEMNIHPEAKRTVQVARPELHGNRCQCFDGFKILQLLHAIQSLTRSGVNLFNKSGILFKQSLSHHQYS